MPAAIPGIEVAKFQEIAAAAKQDSPLSKALVAVSNISLNVSLK